jgi:hypothetical protein
LGLKIDQEIAKLINFELFSCFKSVAYAQSHLLVIFVINAATSLKIQGKYLSCIYIGEVYHDNPCDNAQPSLLALATLGGST